MAILTVGLGQQFATIQAAVAASASGDTINVQSGTYTDDFLTIDHDLTLQAIGGPVHMVETVQPPNGKAMIDELGNVNINGFDISGVTVTDGNGAAIRYEGGNLVLNNCYIHNNQDGLLGAADPTGNITINNSEFAFNGGGTGNTHNIYVGAINTFTVDSSYFHDANVGHEIKSRAANNIITNNRIYDLQSTASYSIDLPDGGNATITGNVIEQGPNTQNPAMFAYAEESHNNPGTSVNFSNNTIINDDPSGTFALNGNLITAFNNNQVFGYTASQLPSGSTTFLATEPTLNTDSTWNVGICFLAGTMITTPNGAVPIEKLAIGDLVVTLNGNKNITWIGQGHALVIPGRRTAATPIVIHKGALADNIPNHDLRLTKGHALFLAGVLIPIEELINHRSIIWDDRIRSVRLYHIELEEHGILFANGVAAESYRNDKNRVMFDNKTQRCEVQKPCAPLVSDGELVNEVWRTILRRSGQRPGIPVTNDPELYLMVDGNRVNLELVNNEYSAVLSTKPNEVRICSRAAIPQELGIIRDPRMLGVAIKYVVLQESGTDLISDRQRVFGANELLNDGFHVFEPLNGISWTNGNAGVPSYLFDELTSYPIIIILHLGSKMIYLDEGSVEKAA